LFQFFFEFRQWLRDEYEVFFPKVEEGADEETEEEEDTFTRWGWAGLVFDLCKDDITKLEQVQKQPIILVMNWLSYQYELNEKIKKKNEKKL